MARILTALIALLIPLTGAAPAHADPAFRVLVFSRTTGFRHDSIPDGIAAIQKLGQENKIGRAHV